MEFCIDLTSFFKLSVLRATSTWSSELVPLKKSWAKSTRSSPAEKFFPEPVNSTTRQSLSEERSSKHCWISLQWEISHINKQSWDWVTPTISDQSVQCSSYTWKCIKLYSTHLQKAWFMALLFSGRFNWTLITYWDGELTSRVSNLVAEQ